MTSIRKFALALVGVLTAAGAVAQSQRQPDSVEQRLEKIEQALARLEAQSGSSRHGAMKELAALLSRRESINLGRR